MKCLSTFRNTRHVILASVLLFGVSAVASAQPYLHTGPDLFEGGYIDPVSSAIAGRDIRVPNTDQSIDGVEQSNAENLVFEDAFDGTVLSMTGNVITHIASPNDDMRDALRDMVTAAQDRDQTALEAAATELKDILLGTTEGRIYDGFSMLNWNRFKGSDFGPIGVEFMPADLSPGDYKTKIARDTGDRFISPFDGEERRIWEIDVNMLYYDGQIDSDTFLVQFPFGHDKDDVLHVNYRIFSLVQEDFSPTLVSLDRRVAQDTVNFPNLGQDSVWIAFFPGEVTNVTVKYPPVRMIRGVYTWGWRVHPPRIQFLQPTYEIMNAHTGEVELDPQSISFAVRNREDLTLDTIGDAAPEMKMYKTVKAVLLDGVDAATIERWMTEADQGPRGTWISWADHAQEQRILLDEMWDVLAAEDGLQRGDLGDFQIVSGFVNNEMYGQIGGQTPTDEIANWKQGDLFKIKLINLDKHTHYFRNVDFGGRLHDDILRCCGGGETSFEVMNFKPSYGAPKVAEMQWRAGWGFRPHHDVIQQPTVFSRGQDAVKIKPYKGGLGQDQFFGYQFSEDFRGGDFRFSPPPFIITDVANPAPFPLRESDGSTGLLIGQRTEGYGVANFCPQDAHPGFCATDIARFNPHGVRNWPPPPLQGQGLCGERAEPCELRFPPFLRNPCQELGVDARTKECGDIIPPTGAWRPFLWINPNNGTLFIDPDDPSKGHWADLTYSHGAPVFAGESLNATVELPRGSGQVFYQFDDLFHDNSIFSPHPTFRGFGDPAEVDEIFSVRAFFQNFVRVRGRISAAAFSGSMSEWVTLHRGPAEGNRCTGPVIASSQVKARPEVGDGSFVFRCGRTCLAQPFEKGTTAPGETICVQSTMGSFAEAVIEP